jgi:tRNA A-37 threonylcarbamoyl transferase component Bud32/predicted nucleotidyltransferase
LRNLSTSEIEAISKTIAHLLKKREMIAMCAYGSQVAGYATGDSDYDIILVLKPFAQRIKYYYLHGEVDCSALVVDSRTIENDCKKSTFGEFVAGRLLNVYSSVSGGEFLKKNEVEFKKRVIIEGLSDAVVDYVQFACEINFPLSYFLFEKLKKRAAIYPPVIYSYSKTYGDELVSSNLPVALNGFREAAAELEREQVISFDEKSEIVHILPWKVGFHGGVSGRIGAAASYTSNSLRQYAIHGYAGRVSPGVVRREVISKISRSRKSSRLPDRIRNPRNEWTIPQSKLFVSSTNWLKDLTEYLGMDEATCEVTKSSLGEFYTTAGFYTLRDPSRKKDFSIAVKRFKDIRGMKWGVLSLWSLKSTDFTVNPTERLYREFRASRILRGFGLATPEIIAVFFPQKLTVSNFIAGTDLSKVEASYLDGKSEELSPIFSFGRDLAIMHNSDYCMGDTKPSNLIFSDEESRIYFTDLEQSHPDGNKTWDLAEFIYYSVRFTLKEERARKLISAFIQGYLEKTENTKALEDAGALRYRAPFQAFIAPNVMSAVRQDLKK